VDHPGYAGFLGNLANHLDTLYARTRNLQDLEAAINHTEAALKATPDDDPSRALWLKSLEREDQQYIVKGITPTSLVPLAAAASLQAGKPPLEALRLQELGRSITNGQLLDYRSDIFDLMEQHPTLAKGFDCLRQQLDSPFSSTVPSSDASMDDHERLQIQQVAIRTRSKIAKDLDDILQQIRQKPGFQTFLRAESEEYFLSAAQEGPIVLLNVTELRSDAILLTKEQVRSIPLPQLSHASMLKHLGTGACGSCGTMHDNKVREEFLELTTDDNEAKGGLLEWLWKAAVQPVLRELGFYPKAVEPLPRIWWIGVGLMARAPIHAAAKFTKGTAKVKTTSLQYCLPSYTSTIRALQYSRGRSRQCQQSESMLIVTMPTTPGAGPLPGVTTEADDIKHSLRDLNTVEILEQPTAENVLQALPGYSIAHFACHGVSSTNPADSHLLLHKTSISSDGLCSEEVDKLRGNDIAALKLPVARLAYLSACNTANSTTFSDEVTHIVSSFHIAGFTNVIGAIWPAEDEACQKMAADFYSTLSKTDNVALPYRNAVLGLIKQKPSQPTYRAPFIHFGA